MFFQQDLCFFRSRVVQTTATVPYSLFGFRGLTCIPFQFPQKSFILNIKTFHQISLLAETLAGADVDSNAKNADSGNGA